MFHRTVLFCREFSTCSYWGLCRCIGNSSHHRDGSFIEELGGIILSSGVQLRSPLMLWQHWLPLWLVLFLKSNEVLSWKYYAQNGLENSGNRRLALGALSIHWARGSMLEWCSCRLISSKFSLSLMLSYTTCGWDHFVPIEGLSSMLLIWKGQLTQHQRPWYPCTKDWSKQACPTSCTLVAEVNASPSLRVWFFFWIYALVNGFTYVNRFNSRVYVYLYFL